ncbi:MAG TPA: SPOR domain-containing protein [Pyrinomonadaceae bacterium]|jgi:cell division protein FtsN
MKLICPNCHYTVTIDAASSRPDGDGETACARCGEPMNQLLWNGSQPSTLATAIAAPKAIAPQRIMENQNAYAPSAEPSFDDVLEIPTPLRSAQPVTDQMLVLEDVIPAQDFSDDDEIPDSQIEFTDDAEGFMSEREDGPIHPAEASALDDDKSQLAGPQVYGASQTSSFDYEGGRAWLRIAPMLLLLGTLVFFALYYLGNRVGVRDRTQEAAATQPSQPETQSAAPAAALPENSQNASQSLPPAEGNAAVTAEPVQSTTAAQSTTAVVASKDETPKPVEEPKVETAKTESKPPATQPAPAVNTPTAPAATTPVADQGTGNFTVQVGSYNNAAQADERVSRLRSGGVEARVVRAEIPHRGTWYRVQAGRFTSQMEAARYATELKGKGATDDFVVTSAQNQ